jgi:hypothetical protein
MTKLTNLSSWLSSVACGVCLVLAVLATPGVARADPPCDCCGSDPGPGDPPGHQVWENCVTYCIENGGVCFAACSNSVCSVTCVGSYPQCGTGTCNKKPVCVDARCNCMLILAVPSCECVSPP